MFKVFFLAIIMTACSYAPEDNETVEKDCVDCKSTSSQIEKQRSDGTTEKGTNVDIDIHNTNNCGKCNDDDCDARFPCQPNQPIDPVIPKKPSKKRAFCEENCSNCNCYNGECICTSYKNNNTNINTNNNVIN